MYVISGIQEGVQVADVNKINLFDGRITQASPITRPREDASVVALADNIRVFGGRHNEEVLSSCEAYDAIADRQVELTDVQCRL